MQKTEIRPATRGPRDTVARFLDSPLYTFVLALFVLFSVFAWDIKDGWLPSAFGPAIEVIMSIVFFAFLLELVLMMFAQDMWWRNPSFWIYFIATAMMIFDIPWISTVIFGSMSGLGSIANLRLLKLFRVLARLGRLLRIIKSLVLSNFRAVLSTVFSKRSNGTASLSAKIARRKIADASRSKSYDSLERATTYAVVGIFCVIYIVATSFLSLLERSDSIRVSVEVFAQWNAVLTLLLIVSISYLLIVFNWLISRFSLELSGALNTLAQALEERDAYTRMHSKNVSRYAVRVAGKMGLSKNDRKIIQIAGELHDIGKIGVSQQILGKPAKLDDDEYKVMKRHTEQGANILNHLVDFEAVILAACHHHEKYDGKGYPSGLSGDEIPQMARILAVCDVWDALTTDRPYRKAMELDEAKKIILAGKGSDFDPEVVDAFLETGITSTLATS